MADGEWGGGFGEGFGSARREGSSSSLSAINQQRHPALHLIKLF